MLYLIMIFLTSSASFLAYFYWSRRHLYRAAAKIKGNSGLPFIGSALTLIGKSEDLFEKINGILEQVQKEPIKFWFGPFLLVALKNPEHLEKIMSSPKFAYKHELYEFLEKVLGDGLITASGLKPKYKIHRRTIQPLFDLKFVENTMEIIQKHTKICMDELEHYVNTGNINIENIFHKCSIDFNSEIILGQKMNRTSSMEFLTALTDMYDLSFTRMLKLWLHPDIIYDTFSKGKMFKKMERNLHAFVEEALIDSWKRRKLSLTRFEDKFVPVIDKLSEIVELNPGLIDSNDLVNHLLTLFAASEDTFAIITSFAAVCFGMYPEYQQKAAEEIRAVIGTTPRDVITLTDIQKLNYLDMCIKDVMRLFPIAPFILRRINEDYHLGHWTIPKGCAVVVPIYSLHRDPEYWTNPNHFYPDNFLPEAVVNRHVYSYMPFSAGPRGCIGKTFANVQLKVFLANFLQRYEVEADGTVGDIELKSDISVRPKKGYNCRIKKRIWS